jgi:hypothetical protein
MKKTQQKNHGFGIPESLGFLTGMALLGLVIGLPLIKTLKKTQETVKRENLISSVEIAKSEFDQEKSAAEKKKFEMASDEARFQMIAYKLKTSNPEKIKEGTGIVHLRINKLSAPVQTE